ncbi:DUF4381 domain-containing protein [Microbulbifer pacificus]|uniref:DUF4381 domain-containing protein n=1 Tax=Microbulbifer pacificus TaxID=407164 RepID=A0AAU0MZI0_9GAMM|nr:DUF4381 domain-containing protein [Microbulbifer pacificus]WOX05151.1 DUF4381 domain-containing protein [Microbulbifer pacificus]
MQQDQAKPDTGSKLNSTPAAAEETLPDMIAQLVPPPEPPAVSMWPATPAAKSVGALLLLMLLFFVWRRIQTYRANAYRRAALAELQQAADDPARIAEILRRTALVAYPRTQVAALTGDDWLGFLNQHYPGNAFTGEVGRTLLQSPYRKAAPTQSGALAQVARDWIRQHKVERPSFRQFRWPRKNAEAPP